MNAVHAHPPLASVKSLLEDAQLPVADLTDAHQSTREFAGICPASSAFMSKQL